MGSVGVIGYGRFGRALLEIFSERGFQVSAFDPHADIPPSIWAQAEADLVARSRFIFVAVPVSDMPDSFLRIKPLLLEHHIVIDVGSVKLAPCRAMALTFGSSNSWVSSHPLFGPVSIARAEALRVVICPNGVHGRAEEEVASLYRSVGCEIIEMGPEEHDRIMAQTHAVAFFVAKGMLDAGIPTDSHAAPPSFQAMARTIESVRGDAGHLLPTLHRDNPFAAEYRRRLLTVLASLDRRLNKTSPPDTGGEDVALSMPTSAHLPELSATRERIDEVDREIVQLLHRRADLVRRAQRAKSAAGRGVVDPKREAELLKVRESWAEESGLDGEGVRAIFEAIINLSCEIQLDSVSD